MTDLKSLIDEAIAASKKAYAPYSKFHVGAVLVAEDGQHYMGCNIENASYPATICAERTALVKAVSEGQMRFTTIVVATSNGGSPCGICRQMLSEFSPQIRVVCCDFEGNISIDSTLAELIPYHFGPAHLSIEP